MFTATEEQIAECASSDYGQSRLADALLGLVIGPMIPLFGVISSAGVIRCECGEKGCRHSGKHPRKKLDYATKDESEVREWLDRWPNMNFGVRLGDVIAFDIDVKRYPDGSEDNGLVSWECIQEYYAIRPPSTVRSISGRGGGCGHIFFRALTGERVGNRVNVFRGIDLRGDGGYVVLPGSRHCTGRLYRWEPDCSPAEAQVEVLPSELHELLSGSPGPTSARLRAKHNIACSSLLRSEGELLLKEQYGVDLADFAVRPNATPPRWKLSDLLSPYKENHLKILATYEMQRGPGAKLAMSDHSPSAYEQALADYAACNKWTPQEIVDLLVCWRTKHGFPLDKLNRMRLISTLEKAYFLAMRNGKIRKRPGRGRSETTQSILELNRQGRSNVEIASRLGVTQAGVRMALMRHRRQRHV